MGRGKGHLGPVAAPALWGTLRDGLGQSSSGFGAFLGLNSNWDHLLKWGGEDEMIVILTRRLILPTASADLDLCR